MALTRILLLEYNQTLRNKLSEKFREDYPRLEDRTIQSYLDRFKELKHRFPMDKRDVTKLKWDEVEHLVDGFTSTRAKLGTVKIASEDGNLVYDNGNGIRIFHGKDKDACIKYSTGYTFCIGSKSEDRNQYDHYRGKIGGGSPYFVVNQNLSNTHDYHISVVYTYYSEPDMFDVTNAPNNKETHYNSKQELKRFYEKQFKTKLDDKFVDVIIPVQLDIITEIIKLIDKGSYYLSEGDVNLMGMNLKTLKFFDKPWIVKGNFGCSFNQLTSLEGAPQQVGRNFYCYNNKLKTLEGAPQEVDGNFHCHNNQLTTLEGAPQRVGGGFYCHNNQLTTLEGAPQRVDDEFYYRNNPNLPQEEIDRYLRSIGKKK